MRNFFLYLRLCLFKLFLLCSEVLGKILTRFALINGFFLPIWAFGLVLWGAFLGFQADELSFMGFSQPLFFKIYGAFLALMGSLTLVSFFCGKLDLQRLRWWLRLRFFVLGSLLSVVYGFYNISSSTIDFLQRIEVFTTSFYSCAYVLAQNYDHLFLPDLDSTSEQLGLAIVAVFVVAVKLLAHFILEHVFWVVLAYTMLPFAFGVGSTGYMAVQMLMASEIIEHVMKTKIASGVSLAKFYPFSNDFPLVELYRQSLRGNLIKIPLDPRLEEFMQYKAKCNAAIWAKALPIGMKGSLASLLDVYNKGSFLPPKSPLLNSRDPSDFILLETVVEYHQQVLTRVAFVIDGKTILLDSQHVGDRFVFFKGDSGRTIESLYNYIQHQRDSLSETLIANLDALLTGYRGNIPLERPSFGLHADYVLGPLRKDVKVIWTAVSLRDADHTAFRVLQKAGISRGVLEHIRYGYGDPDDAVKNLKATLKKLSAVDEVVIVAPLPKYVSILETKQKLSVWTGAIQSLAGSDCKMFKPVLVDSNAVNVEVAETSLD